MFFIAVSIAAAFKTFRESTWTDHALLTTPGLAARPTSSFVSSDSVLFVCVIVQFVAIPMQAQLEPSKPTANILRF